MSSKTTSEKSADDLYELFFSTFEACGVAHIASKSVYPDQTWQAIYKRIKKNSRLYRRYCEIVANNGNTRMRNELAGRTDQTADLCRLIASGMKVYAAARKVYPDRKPRNVIAEIKEDPSKADLLAAAREKNQRLAVINDKEKKRLRDAAYRQRVKSDPKMAEHRRNLLKKHRDRWRDNEAWRSRNKLMRAVSKEAKMTGKSTKEIQALWKVPPPNEWRWLFVDYSKYNIQGDTDQLS